ncbi:tape-measure protein [Streptomyces sudanensis]|uniref:tape-measure protein n=1 Tax=Streptomyces sudanensis TaxID=436397 RepID=UPI0020CEF260|nr:tape-measure protein [Streptomyces sudanensis]MCQ0001698.1 tape-measure protein [Streptomyces sudanensis]
MSTAQAAQVNAIMVHLRGLPGALNSFRSQVRAATRTIAGVRDGLGRGTTALDRVRSSADSAAVQVRQVKACAESSGRALAKAGRTAATAGTQIRGGTGRTGSAAAPLKSLASGAGSFGGAAGLLGKATGPLSRIMSVLGTGLTLAAGAMTAVNVAMRANPLGFLAGLVVPVVTAITAYALNTETGQKIVKQVFDHVLKVFRGIATFLGPVVTSYGTVVGAYFKAVGAVVTTVAGIVGAAVSGDFGRAGAAVSRATGALSDLVRRPWNAFKAAVRPVLDWITRRIPDMFTRVRDATSGTLGGIGDFVSTGLQALAGVVTGPIKGLIAFANWVIDGLNSLGGEFLGKKFGVDLDKIPQLAEGGVVAPSYDGASAVRPLSSLDRLRPAEAGHRVDAPRPPHRGRLHTYREPEGRSALAIAEDLLFLHRTAA